MGGLATAPRSEPTADNAPLLPGVAEITLTEEEAQELIRRIDHPTALPTRPPQSSPVGDPSLLRQPAR